VGEESPAHQGNLLTGLAPGARIAGYRLEEQIGAGGMAVVFRARDERLGRLVALKIVAPALAADERFRQRFAREAQAAAAVDDPHILPVYEAGESGGVLFMAIRLVRGGDVRSLLSRTGPLAPAQVISIISPVASALDAAHAAGLVHRDVKPANMLLDSYPGRPDHVYLSDFGLSKAAQAAGLTGSGQFVGTPDYTAPEQIAGRPVDGRADQYGLACAAFELLTGEVPFHLSEGVAAIYAHLSKPPPALTSRRRDLPPAVDPALARALAKAPEHRYASCREFADALRGSLSPAPYHLVSGPAPGGLAPGGLAPGGLARRTAPGDRAPGGPGPAAPRPRQPAPRPSQPGPDPAPAASGRPRRRDRRPRRSRLLRGALIALGIVLLLLVAAHVMAVYVVPGLLTQ
jgi:serine/threonine protein kinase